MTEQEQEQFLKEQKRIHREMVLLQGYEANISGWKKDRNPFMWLRGDQILWNDGWDLAQKEKDEFVKKNFVPSYKVIEPKSHETEYLEPIELKGK